MSSREPYSPRRDRYEPYARDRDARADRYDRDRPRSRSPPKREREGGDPYGRSGREYYAGPGGQRGGRGDRDGQNGYAARDRERERDREYAPRDNRGGEYRGEGRAAYGYDRDGGRGGGGYSGGRRGREDDYDYNRPLDRRAIEEGRRRREEERARGVVLDDPTAKREPREEPEPSRGREGEGEGEEGEEEEEDPMAAMMGFGGFGTTKGKGIGQNAEGAVKVNKQRTWRQYMNRRGGFNRPLDKIK